jgi:hypothetical protein
MRIALAGCFVAAVCIEPGQTYFRTWASNSLLDPNLDAIRPQGGEHLLSASGQEHLDVIMGILPTGEDVPDIRPWS